MRTRAGSPHSSGAGFPATSRFLHAACERLSSDIFLDGSETLGAQRPDGGGGERIRKGLSGCRGRQSCRELWDRGQASKRVLGQREWSRQTEGGEKLKMKDRSTGEVEGEKKKEIRRLSRRADQLPILRAPQVEFCFQIFKFVDGKVLSTVPSHEDTGILLLLIASQLEFVAFVSLSPRGCSLSLSRAYKLLPRLLSLPPLSAPASFNIDFTPRNDPPPFPTRLHLLASRVERTDCQP